jgi:hypothetical protein
MRTHPPPPSRDGNKQSLILGAIWQLAARSTRGASAQDKEGQQQNKDYHTGINEFNGI